MKARNALVLGTIGALASAVPGCAEPDPNRLIPRQVASASIRDSVPWESSIFTVHDDVYDADVDVEVWYRSDATQYKPCGGVIPGVDRCDPHTREGEAYLSARYTDGSRAPHRVAVEITLYDRCSGGGWKELGSTGQRSEWGAESVSASKSARYNDCERGHDYKMRVWAGVYNDAAGENDEHEIWSGELEK